MFIAYTASHTPIQNADFEKIGSGTGVNRYAHGMYFGELPTAQHYLKQYQGFHDAAHRFVFNDIELSPGSPAHSVAQILMRNKMDRTATEQEVDGDPKLVDALLVIWPEDTASINLDVEYGALHKVTIPQLKADTIPHWDDVLDPDTIRNYAEKIIDTIYTYDDFSILLADHRSESGLELLDDLLENALDAFEHKLSLDIDTENVQKGIRGLVEDELDVDPDASPSDVASSIRDVLRDDIDIAWSNAAIGNDYEAPEYEHPDAIALFMMEPGAKMLENIAKKHTACFQIHDELTIGDFYAMVASTHPGDGDGKKHASQIFSDILKIDAIAAPSMEGDEGANEYVILSQRVLNGADFQVLSSEDVEVEMNAHTVTKDDVAHHMDRHSAYRY